MTATVGRWELLKPIGSGGAADVYLGRDSSKGELAAVKLIRPDNSLDAGKRLRTEVRALKEVNGRTPHLPAFIEATLEGPRPFVATEYLEGVDLRSEIEAHGGLGRRDPERLRRIACDVADALTCLHDMGLRHRDVKPHNVIWVPGRGAVLIDLGIVHGYATRYTAAGTYVGSAGYTAKELLLGEEASPESDVFAWASTIAAIADGRPVFGDDDAVAVQRVLADLPELGPWLSDALQGEGPDRELATLVRLGLSPYPVVRPSPMIIAALVLSAEVLASEMGERVERVGRVAAAPQTPSPRSVSDAARTKTEVLDASPPGEPDDPKRVDATPQKGATPAAPPAESGDEWRPTATSEIAASRDRVAGTPGALWLGLSMLCSAAVPLSGFVACVRDVETYPVWLWIVSIVVLAVGAVVACYLLAVASVVASGQFWTAVVGKRELVGASPAALQTADPPRPRDGPVFKERHGDHYWRFEHVGGAGRLAHLVVAAVAFTAFLAAARGLIWLAAGIAFEGLLPNWVV